MNCGRPILAPSPPPTHFQRRSPGPGLRLSEARHCFFFAAMKDASTVQQPAQASLEIASTRSESKWRFYGVFIPLCCLSFISALDVAIVT